MKIIRTFPRKTSASPDDALAYFGPPDFWASADEVHISVTWTYDLPRAEWLAKQWEPVAKVQIGGPATGMLGEDFTPGMYLKTGYVITSRGCPNRCWFCSVWRRDGLIRELKITDGWNVLDDNLLACSPDHIRAVFQMLSKYRGRVEFTGGLEAKRLEGWHVEHLAALRPKQIFFAYDSPDDFEPLVAAANLLKAAGLLDRHKVCCYVLCGQPKDSITQADFRMHQCVDLGIFPRAMVWMDSKGDKNADWAKFQRAWSRPAIIHSMLRDQTKPFGLNHIFRA